MAKSYLKIERIVYVLAKRIEGTPSANTVSYLMIDRDGIADYTRDPARAHKWKTRKGAQKWLDVRGGYGDYKVLEYAIWS